VERGIKEFFHRMSGIYRIAALVGTRQAGKTTFLRHEIEGVPGANYVLLDDPDARGMFNEDIKKFDAQYIRGHRVTVLDEVQNCENVGERLKYLADIGGEERKIWLTSSSESILSKEVVSYLVGRVSVQRLFPFSFPEFLSARGQRALTLRITERMVWEHMTYGGYPAVVLTEDHELKRTILRDLHETMLLKDAARTFSINNISALESLSRYLAHSAGEILSYDRVSDALNLSFQTLKKYLNAMEKSYLILRVPPYFTNRKKEITKLPKLYFIDTGLRNAVADVFPPGAEGRLFENYVLTELLKMGFRPKYWRTKSGAEVDFIVEKEGLVIPVEVKLHASRGKINRSLRSFITVYSPESAIVVHYREDAVKKGKEPVDEREMIVGDCTVKFTDIPGLWSHLHGERHDS